MNRNEQGTGLVFTPCLRSSTFPLGVNTKPVPCSFFKKMLDISNGIVAYIQQTINGRLLVFEACLSMKETY